jgi:hypothetical protein
MTEKLLTDWSDLVAARVVFVKAVHENEQSTSDILRIIIYSNLIYYFPRKSHDPPHGGTP